MEFAFIDEAIDSDRMLVSELSSLTSLEVDVGFTVLFGELNISLFVELLFSALLSFSLEFLDLGVSFLERDSKKFGLGLELALESGELGIWPAIEFPAVRGISRRLGCLVGWLMAL